MGAVGRPPIMSAPRRVPRELEQLVRDALPGVAMQAGGVERQLEAKASGEMQHYLRLVLMRTAGGEAHVADVHASERWLFAMLEAIKPTLRG